MIESVNLWLALIGLYCRAFKKVQSSGSPTLETVPNPRSADISVNMTQIKKLYKTGLIYFIRAIFPEIYDWRFKKHYLGPQNKSLYYMYKIILFLLYLFATLSFPMVGILSHEYFCQYNKKTSGLFFYYQSHIYNMFIGSIQTATHTKFSCECSYCQIQSLFWPQLG